VYDTTANWLTLDFIREDAVKNFPFLSLFFSAHDAKVLCESWDAENNRVDRGVSVTLV
jgi:hypothetical protein